MKWTHGQKVVILKVVMHEYFLLGPFWKSTLLDTFFLNTVSPIQMAYPSSNSGHFQAIFHSRGSKCWPINNHQLIQTVPQWPYLS